MTPRHERALIRRILAGDKTAAEELVRAHQPSLFAYMLRMTARPEVAEDVVQEAMVRALTNLHRYDPRFRFSTWLFTIAKRLHVNAVQRLAPSFDTDTVSAAGSRTWEPQSATLATAQTTGNRHEALKDALESLTPDQREAIILFYQLQWSVEQIGEYLDCPVGTIKSHLHRARKRMRDVLEERANESTAVREAIA